MIDMSIYPADTVAVIFSAKRSARDAKGYDDAAAQMVKLAKHQDGFVGIDSVRDEHGYGITISYWRDDKAAKAWRDHAQHAAIRDKGREIWYERYSLHVAKIERAYDWTRDE